MGKHAHLLQNFLGMQLPKIIEIGQYLAKFLQKWKGWRFFWNTV